MEKDDIRWMAGDTFEADFEKGTLTFQMVGEYWARAGRYVIIQEQLFEKLTNPPLPQKEPQ